MNQDSLDAAALNHSQNSNKSLHKSGMAELLLLGVFLVLGFLFWEWGLIINAGGGIGGFLFFTVATATTFAYLCWQGVKPRPISLAALAVVLLGALPFLLYDQRDISIYNFVFEICAFVLWVAINCRTTISQRLSGFILFDLVNQTVVVPIVNFANLFSVFKKAPNQANSTAQTNPTNPTVPTTQANPEANLPKSPRTYRSPITVIVSLLISIPLIVIVVVLLMASDDGFSNFIQSISNTFDTGRILRYAAQLVFGVPVAGYILGSVLGNARRNRIDAMSEQGVKAGLAKVRILPRFALYGPLVLLVVIYCTFFFTMAAYLFSAFGGDLPASYTYAQYARSGFFELCSVAAINLGLLSFIYLLTRRQKAEYPKLLRILTGSISLLTCLLIVTAISKMLLYIQSYGLTRLRIYTTWFMVLLLLVFIVLIIWHIKPFNAGKPLAIIPVVCILVLFLSNTDGIIAQYNVDQYLAEKTQVQAEVQSQAIDTSMLAHLSDAALPALAELADTAPDPEVRKQALQEINDRNKRYQGISMRINPSREGYYNWNIQSAYAKSLGLL